MLRIAVGDLARVMDGHLVAGPSDISFEHVSVDSRKLKQGALFVPIKGARFDGHAFISDALAGGAGGAVVASGFPARDLVVKAAASARKAMIAVDDPMQALWDIASFNRRNLNVPVVAITGSTGKTSTKDMLTAVVGRKRKTVAAEKSFNNEIGVPLTLLRADGTTEVLILELAMRARGEIKALAELSRPSIGLITNVGLSHVERLGSQENIAQEKAELIQTVNPDGMVGLAAGEEWTRRLTAMSRARVRTFGMTEEADIKALSVSSDGEGRASFVIDGLSERVSVKLPFPGRHHVLNALAASLIADELGITHEDIKVGLESAKLSPMRMQVAKTSGGLTIINDAYNSNPASVTAALQTLADVEAPGKRIAVLGDMLELGEQATRAHEEMGRVVACLPIDILLLTGDHAQSAAEGALAGGYPAEAIFIAPDLDSCQLKLAELAESGDVILFKASRNIGLERVIDVLARSGG